MEQQTTAAQGASRPDFTDLEAWVRGRIQEWIQELLEEEVSEVLGRRKSERRSAVDGQGYRNGHGKPRHLTLSGGTITLRRPRVRDVEERFQSRVLPLFARRTQEISDLLPQLSLHGLAEGDFELALRGLLGDEAPVSASTVARLKEKWHAEWVAWGQRSLEDLEVVYLWVDGIYVKAGLEKEKAAVLVAIAGLSDGRKMVVTVSPGYRESTASWSDVLRDLKQRGMNTPALVVGDGHLGIWGALRNVSPEAEEQRCWNHKLINVLDKVPKAQQEAAKGLVRLIPYAETKEKAEQRRKEFTTWCRQRGYESAADTIERDWEQLTTFYRFPQEHWKHLRTTNPVESPFAALRLRTDAAKRYKRVDRATPLIWKLLLVGEQRFRRLNAPQLLQNVYQGVRFVNGRRKDQANSKEEVAA